LKVVETAPGPLATHNHEKVNNVATYNLHDYNRSDILILFTNKLQLTSSYSNIALDSSVSTVIF